MAPDSSASTWPKLIQRRDATGSTRPTASDTSGNIPRGPVWNSVGSSPAIRNWLNVKPPGATSGTHVERRNTPSAISWMLVVSMPASCPRTTGVRIGVATPN